MRDLYSNIKTATAIRPQVHSDSATGGAIDLIGANAACVVVTTGAINGAGDLSIKLQDSDTTTPADFVDVAASLVDSNAPTPLEADSDYRLGYRGHKRYIRAVMTKAGGEWVQAAAVCVLGDLAEAPAA